MTKLQPIGTFDTSPEFFKIANNAATRATTYYTFPPDGKRSLQSQSHWELVGIRYRPNETLPLAVRLLHIEEEDLLDEEEWPDYEAERDAGSFLSVTPAQMDALGTFFESWARTLRVAGTSSAPLAETDARFCPLTRAREELAALGITEKQMPLLVAPNDTLTFYRYEVSGPTSSPEMIGLLHFTPWSSQNPRTALTGLGFDEFEHHRTGPEQSEVVVRIIGSRLLLDAASAQQFAILLRRHGMPSQ